MAYRKIARRCEWRNAARCPLPLGCLAVLAMFCFAAAPPARAQAAVEYSGATGVSAGAANSRPRGFPTGGHAGRGNSRMLAKPVGPSPAKINRAWFAKQAGRHGAQLSIDAVPPQSQVWIDGKFVGETPLRVTLPAGKYHVSLMGRRQEHAAREIEIASGKNQRLEIHLEQTYPYAVSIPVFGRKKH